MQEIGTSVAIIGVSAVFPEAATLDQFYQNLKNGRDSIREVSESRLRDVGANPYTPYLPVGCLERVDAFDYPFFNISKREADRMNPEQRLLLQLACEAIENAGYRLGHFQGTLTGVFMGGGSSSDYASLLPEFEPAVLTGNLNAITAGRIAYSLNLHGPAIMLDTSCSSALTAIYEAYQKLVSGEIDYALAGAVYVITKFPELSEAAGGVGIMAEDGRSKAFAAGANGTGGGEGGGVLLLKRLDQALADGDSIHAVIRGGAANHDGSRSAGLTAPSVKAQTEVIARAWRRAGVSPETITAVEAHGTGTKLGDPIEFEALTEAFAQFTDRKKFCALGSVKTNLGHLNNGAGVAGVVKTLLALRHGELFPSLHYTRPNPFIDAENTALLVNTQWRPWARNGSPRRCGVSAFGLSGTNVHLLLEEAPDRPGREARSVEPDWFLKIAAKTPPALRRYAETIHDFLSVQAAKGDDAFADALYTLNHGRDDYACRLALVAQSPEALLRRLSECCEHFDAARCEPVREDCQPAVVALFSSDSVDEGVAAQLAARYPLFAEQYASVLALHPGPDDRLRVMAFQYALYRQWQAWGMPVKTVIATGIGRLTKQVVVDGLALEKAVEALGQPDAAPEGPDEAKLRKAIKRLEQPDAVFFLEMGVGGILSRSIQPLLDPAGNASVAAFVEAGGEANLLGQVARLYPHGIAPDWSRFYAGKPLRKVEAPTYPFEKIRCWVEPRTPAAALSAPAGVDEWLYDLRWEQSGPVRRPAESLRDRTWLVVMDEAGLGETLAGQLEGQGNRCIRVYPGGAFATTQTSAGPSYRMDLTREAEYERLAAALAGESLDGLIHLAAYAPAAELSAHTLETSLQTDVLSAFFLMKALHPHLKRHVYFALVTAQATPVTAGAPDLVLPVRSASAALLKGLMAEYPLLKVHHIDVAFAPETLASTGAGILAELASDDPFRFVVHHRDQRYVPHLRKAAPAATPGSPAIQVRPGGVYIVTGGASGIGFEVARYLAQRANIHLIVLGQTTLPPREQWPAPGAGDALARRVANLRALEALGGRVDYYAVDLGDRQAVRDVFGRITQEVGKVEGIVHSAGVPGNWEPLYRKEAADFRSTLLPKVQGTVYLDESSRHLSPAFFIVFSSLNAVVAQKHSADYAVANAFLDAYAARRDGPQRFLSIAWPGWYETGMSLRRLETAGGQPGDPLQPISTADGLRAFERALGLGLSNVWVANVDLKAFAVNPYFRLGQPGKAAPGPAQAVAPGESVAGAPAPSVGQRLAAIWREVLGAETIRPEDDFFDLGGHSLNGSQVVNRVEKEWGVKLELDDLFENGALAALTALVEQRMAGGKATHYQEIRPVGAKPHYAVSHAQRRLWVLHQLKEEQIAYNITNSYVFQNIDPDAFARAFGALVARHESLRTTFFVRDGQPWQKIHPADAFGLKLAYDDLRDGRPDEQAMKGYASQAAQTVFDLEKGPLVHARLLRWTEHEYVFIYVIHHIISDGWSMEVLEQELLKFYDAFSRRQPNPLSPLPIQYKDYAAWHNDHLSDEAVGAHRQYWLDQFSGEIPVLQLPTDFPRPTARTFQGSIIRTVLDKSLCDGLQRFSQQKDVSLFMTLQALVKTLMYRYTGQDDIVIGTVEAGRNHQNLENQIGYYVNTLALRTRFAGQASFDALLQAVKAGTLQAFEHKLYPFDLLVDELGVPRNMSRAPLFDVSIALQNLDILRALGNAGGEKLPGGPEGIGVRSLEMENTTFSKFDLTLVFILVEGGLLVHVEYSTDLFTPQRIHRLVDHLAGLGRAVLADSSVALDRLDYLGEAEKRQLLVDFNDTAAGYPHDVTMAGLFERVAAQHPERPALVCIEQTLTYRQLNEAANQLAHFLRETYHILPAEPVGLMVNRSERMVIAMLGVLKAGGAYLPIDPAYPEDRKAYMLADAGVRVLLTEMDLLFGVSFFGGDLFALDVQLADLPTPLTNPPACTSPEADAYVIYTSGSTGKPKGVRVAHRGYVNMALDQIERFGIRPEDKVLQFASFSFDASVYEIGMALYAGATLVMPDKALIGNPGELVPYLRGKGVTVATLPPVYLATLDKQALHFLRILITAGEAAHVRDAVACSQFCTYYNAYGPTEASVCVSTYRVSGADGALRSIPIGLPIRNTQLHLLDARGELVPIGVDGEICIAGAGLANGYLNQPELTARRFAWHPGLQTQLYHTGDVGRRLPDGNIAFVGRKDEQLKVRGYRIEPGEIAAVIERHPGVQDAFVLVQENRLPGGSPGDSGAIALTAVITPDQTRAAFALRQLPERTADGESGDAGQAAGPAGAGAPPGEEWTTAPALLDSVKAWCRASLPAYMMPAAFRLIPQLPLTVHGKVDKEALQRWEQAQQAESQPHYLAPGTELEKQLVQIWEQVLAKSPIGTGDNFFELGGHSLKATQIVARIHQEIGAKVELSALFNHLTVGELAGYLTTLIERHGLRAHFEPIRAAGPRASYPLSHAQRRLWVLNQFEENRFAYLIPTAYRLSGEVATGAFEAAFDALVTRYEILRTTFLLEEDGPRQRVRAAAELGLFLEQADLRQAENPEAAVQEWMARESSLPFDLENGPLLRAKLLRVADDRYYFLLTLHHIITDGWSLELLTNELIALYNAYRQGKPDPLPELSIQYKDYSVWQHEQLQRQYLQQQRDYWLAQLGGEIPVLELPADQKRPPVKTYNGGFVELLLDEVTSRRLKAISQEQEASLFIVLLASVYAFLHRYSGQNTLILGTTIAGRPHKDLENQVGFFVNTLALRNTVHETDGFGHLIGRVRETALAGFENQEYPFDRLVDDLGLARDVSRFPLFDVLVEYANLDIYNAYRQEMEGVRIEPYPADFLLTKFDIAFRFGEQDGNGMALRLEFNTDLYAKTSMERLVAHYARLLESLVQFPDQPIHAHAYLPQPEIDRLLGGFNATAAPFPEEKTVLDLFAAQVALTPDAAALVFGEHTWTYRALDEASNQVAHLLRQRGVDDNTLVGLMMARSEKLIIALWGILKAGAAYVPIDADQPAGRIRYLLEDSAVQWLVTDQEMAPEVAGPAVTVIDPALPDGADGRYSRLKPAWTVVPGQLAYVIYTSGSTGHPKGVMVEHRSVVNLSAWLGELVYRQHPQPLTALLTASVSFDASVQQLFAPLLNGARLVVIPEATRRDPDLYLDALVRYGVEVADITPSFLAPVLAALRNRAERPPLRYTLVGGEALGEELTAEFRGRMGEESQLINVYGITEATVNSTFERVTGRRAGANSIGKPLPNTQVYVLDAHRALMPIGLWGELYIGGAGVARGYLHREALTRERFVAHPFAPGQRLYRTGDVGRWLPDGSLEYLGRSDFQVKIRGFRVETGEVESVLLRHEAIREAVVAARPDAQQESHLVAYFTGPQPIETAELRAWLGRHLPYYMMPAFLVQLDAIPLNTSGKVDRKALPDPEAGEPAARAAYVAPANALEESLVALLEDLLPGRRIGVRDHFFAIGGNSLTAARFFRRAGEHWPGALKMSDLFVYDTVEALAAHIGARQLPKTAELVEAESGESGRKFKKITI